MSGRAWIYAPSTRSVHAQHHRGAESAGPSADEVELHLPLHEELGGTQGGALIHRGVVAASAELSGALIASGTTHGVTQRKLVLDYLDDAPAGSALYARARIVAGNVFVEIRASDSRTLVARATLVGVSAPGGSPAGEGHPQPIYPN